MTTQAQTEYRSARFTGLGPEQRRQVEQDGYVIVEGLLSPEECRAYAARLSDYARGQRPLPPGLTLQREPRVERGEVTPSASGDDVRKISGVASGDDLFRALVLHPTIVAIMQELIGPDLKLYRADALLKPAGLGSAKGMHQDAPYWPIEPMTQWSCWMPFDPATPENGCMTAITGSHMGGPLPHMHVADDYVVPDERYDGTAAVALPMAPGSGLFFHSLVLHGTAENRSAQPRRAVTMTYMATASRYTSQAPKPDYLRISGVEVPGGV